MKVCDRCEAVVGELHTVNLNAGFDDENRRIKLDIGTTRFSVFALVLMMSIEDWMPLVSAATQVTKGVIETWMAQKTMREEQKKDFFEHYRKHSIHLVDAFKK